VSRAAQELEHVPCECEEPVDPDFLARVRVSVGECPWANGVGMFGAKEREVEALEGGEVFECTEVELTLLKGEGIARTRVDSDAGEVVDGGHFKLNVS
jgi:hypothetical protein